MPPVRWGAKIRDRYDDTVTGLAFGGQDGRGELVVRPTPGCRIDQG
jgi:hypothetical protein